MDMCMVKVVFNTKNSFKNGGKIAGQIDPQFSFLPLFNFFAKKSALNTTNVVYPVSV